MVAQSIAVQVRYALVWKWDYVNELDLVRELDIQKFELECKCSCSNPLHISDSKHTHPLMSPQ